MLPIVCGSPANRSICCGTRRRAGLCLSLAWHGPLPDSGRQRDVIRPNRRHSMLQGICSAHPAEVPQVSSAPTSRCRARPSDAPWRRPTDQTSTLESPANGSHRNRSDHSGKQRRPAARLLRGCRSEDQTTDARGTAVPETRSRGCSQALLYNEERPHGAIGNKPPIMLQNHDGEASPPT